LSQNRDGGIGLKKKIAVFRIEPSHGGKKEAVFAVERGKLLGPLSQR
jgi:hypothetical protein